MTSHPGTILFVDEASGTATVRPADEVPATIAYARGIDGERLPITRVVRRPTPDGGCEVFCHGPDGTLLQVTRMVQSPGRPEAAGAEAPRSIWARLWAWVRRSAGRAA
jgi:hypothetical protein